MSMLTEVQLTPEEFDILRELLTARYKQDGSAATATVIAKLSALEVETDRERRVQAILAKS
jgi:hypothetical protein